MTTTAWKKVDASLREEWLRTIQNLQTQVKTWANMEVGWSTKRGEDHIIKVDQNLRGNLEKVRTYRNNFAHSGQLPLATFTFDSALSWYNIFLDKLPEPST